MMFPTFQAIDHCRHNHVEWLAERWGVLDLLPDHWRTPGWDDYPDWLIDDYYLNHDDDEEEDDYDC